MGHYEGHFRMNHLLISGMYLIIIQDLIFILKKNNFSNFSAQFFQIITYTLCMHNNLLLMKYYCQIPFKNITLLVKKLKFFMLKYNWDTFFWKMKNTHYNTHNEILHLVFHQTNFREIANFWNFMIWVCWKSYLTSRMDDKKTEYIVSSYTTTLFDIKILGNVHGSIKNIKANI